MEIGSREACTNIELWSTLICIHLAPRNSTQKWLGIKCKLNNKAVNNYDVKLFDAWTAWEIREGYLSLGWFRPNSVVSWMAKGRFCTNLERKIVLSWMVCHDCFCSKVLGGVLGLDWGRLWIRLWSKFPTFSRHTSGVNGKLYQPLELM